MKEEEEEEEEGEEEENGGMLLLHSNQHIDGINDGAINGKAIASIIISVCLVWS